MVSIFFSYSHKDEELRNELEAHLALLKRQGIISAWYDHCIIAGDEIDQVISSELESAKIILLLVSAHFLASDYCYEREMKRGLEKHNDGTAVVIPVILHPCDWHSAPFGNLRATPTDGKPVSMFANQQEAFSIIAKDIREATKVFLEPNAPLQGRSGDGNSEVTRYTGERSSNLRIKRKFDDHERDEFLEKSFEYMARYFEGSLDELTKRNPLIKTRFKRLNEASFNANIYEKGELAAQCTIWYGRGNFGSSIAYSYSGEHHENSFNESLSVIDDGYTLQLKPLGMSMLGGHREESFSQQGAAEFYWNMLIHPLQ